MDLQRLQITMIMSFIVVVSLDSGGIMGENVAYVVIHGIRNRLENIIGFLISSLILRNNIFIL